MVTVLYVSADVEAVRVLWSRSGALAGREVHAQLSLYADALRAAYGAEDPSAEVLVKDWWRPARTARLTAYGGSNDVLQMLRTSGHPRAAGVAEQLDHELARA